jgi:hypothetical protein
MYQGMPLTTDIVRVEGELRVRSLKYHYLVVEERIRAPRPVRRWSVGLALRSLFGPTPASREACC